MHVAKIIAVVLVVGSLMLWGQSGRGGMPIVRSLPFLGGYAPSVVYDGGALLLAGLGVWGLAQLARGSGDDE